MKWARVGLPDGRPLGVGRSALRAIAITALGAYGVVLSVLGAHIWFTFFIAPTPRSFLARREMWATEQQFYLASGVVGVAAFFWFGTGAANGHFGFRSSLPGHSRLRRAMYVGAVYGWGAGALLTLLGMLSMELAFLGQPEPAIPSILLVPVVAGGIGAIVGALMGPVLLKPVDEEDTHQAQRPPPAGWRAWVVVAGAALGLLILPSGTTPPAILGMAVLSATFYFALVRMFVQHVAAIHSGQRPRAVLNVRAWALAAGACCGAGIGLRVAICAAVGGLDARMDYVEFAVSAGAVLGSEIARQMFESAIAGWRVRGAAA